MASNLALSLVALALVPLGCECFSLLMPPFHCPDRWHSVHGHSSLSLSLSSLSLKSSVASISCLSSSSSWESSPSRGQLVPEVSLEDRRLLLRSAADTASAFLFAFSWSTCATLADARVEGTAPPKKALSEEYRQGTAALGDMDDDAPIPHESYKKLPSGLVYADIRPGNGDVVVGPGSRCNVQWVLRRGNGYFVDSSETSGGVPFIFTVGDGTAIAGLDEGIRGMKAGGTRRILMPVSMGYVDGLDDGKPGPLPAGFGPRQQMRRVQNVRKDVPGEYIFLEVQLTRVR